VPDPEEIVPELAAPEPPLVENPLLDEDDEDDDWRVQVPSGSFIQPLSAPPSEDTAESSTLSLWMLLVEILELLPLPPPANPDS